ncbi:hypothetical protein CEUSTIGMA_g4386.t1 [Chlamydomonas eustigma]|uniref:Pre-mRNA 3'-end-processing endonuclease polyadenylation factor C-term domain-containing protein n=1 Tax=Chlamydomonas eustigma TaxID=1157962 RepID=A0A250X1X6_9CHLO|nr:hypothetical protein CEUSTIGMA_g4386.t1 [Chlamydomonas eustigma]|eukprot:GAX76939.1 hypothetical protein CEUSTIGMA_g4386.t1 [Chlamydomonas eustigma]
MTVMQAIGERPDTRKAEAARLAALQSTDPEALMVAELHLIAALLRSQFGPATVLEEDLAVELQVDGEPVLVDYKSGKVVCDDKMLASRVDKAVGRVMQAMRPVPFMTTA